jgi:hypothetical protein
LSPEATILTINAVLLAFAYIWAYPNLPEKRWQSIMWRDAVISIAALVVAGLLFAGRVIAFNLVLFESNWIVFSIVTMLIMETPLFMWFARKYDLQFDETDDD